MSPIQFPSRTLSEPQVHRLADLEDALHHVRESIESVNHALVRLEVHGGVEAEYAKLALTRDALNIIQVGIYREWKGLATLGDSLKNTPNSA